MVEVLLNWTVHAPLKSGSGYSSLRPMSNTILEIGPGRGDFLFHLARENPEKTVVAVEYKRKRYDKLVKRLSPCPNVRLYFGNARDVVPTEFGEESLERVYILYPDPWPKRRHAKHRLFQAPFLKNLSRTLSPSGEVYVATDDPRYRDQIQSVFREVAEFHGTPLDPGTFSTFYANKWKKEGRDLYAMAYRKNGGNNAA